MAASNNKKRTRKPPVEQPVPSMMYQEKKCVRITEADNGFTVSTYGPKGEQIRVARSSAEALRHTREMMGKGK